MIAEIKLICQNAPQNVEVEVDTAMLATKNSAVVLSKHSEINTVNTRVAVSNVLSSQNTASSVELE